MTPPPAQLAALALLVLLAGCHKKVAPPPRPQPPVIAQPASLPEPSINIPVDTTAPPSIPAPAEPTVTAAPRTRRTAPTPAPAAPTHTPPTSLGNLTSGDSSANAQLRNQATSLIADLDKRIAALSASTKRQKSTGLAQVQNFLKQAKDALTSGDPEGANNLAIKSKLLLDDLLK